MTLTETSVADAIREAMDDPQMRTLLTVDRALRADELGEPRVAPAQDEEFVLAHADNVEASGFVQHLKLPHYVDFQAELELVRKLRMSHAEAAKADLAAHSPFNPTQQEAA